MNVAILGSGTKTISDVLAYDKKWEIWGLNSIRPSWVPRWSRMFNLHRYAHLKRDCPQYIGWDVAWNVLNPQVPLYVVDKWPGHLRNLRIFPRAALAKQPRGEYHAGSFDWLVAFAVYLGAKEIALHGIGLALDSWRDEPISARACLEYWCGYAEGRGVRVRMAKDSDLFKQYHLVRSESVYGYDDVRPLEIRA